jgi:hypothetical protein
MRQKIIENIGNSHSPEISQYKEKKEEGENERKFELKFSKNELNLIDVIFPICNNCRDS